MHQIAAENKLENGDSEESLVWSEDAGKLMIASAILKSIEL